MAWLEQLLTNADRRHRLMNVVGWTMTVGSVLASVAMLVAALGP